jgi:hypothetical protein
MQIVKIIYIIIISAIYISFAHTVMSGAISCGTTRNSIHMAILILSILYGSKNYTLGYGLGVGAAFSLIFNLLNNNVDQPLSKCPVQLNDSDPTPDGWREYPKSTRFFHCGFRTILEEPVNKNSSVMMNECVYDRTGTLVTDAHPYSWCKGTPNQYNSRTDPIKHTFIDSGGILMNGIPAFIASRIHDISNLIF